LPTLTRYSDVSCLESKVSLGFPVFVTCIFHNRKICYFEIKVCITVEFGQKETSRFLPLRVPKRMT